MINYERYRIISGCIMKIDQISVQLYYARKTSIKEKYFWWSKYENEYEVYCKEREMYNK